MQIGRVLAGLAAGYWSCLDDIARNWSVERVFTPQITCEEQRGKLRKWNKAVEYTRGWEKENAGEA